MPDGVGVDVVVGLGVSVGGTGVAVGGTDVGVAASEGVLIGVGVFVSVDVGSGANTWQPETSNCKANATMANEALVFIGICPYRSSEPKYMLAYK